MQRDSKDPNQTINLLPSYLRIPFSSKALFCYKHLKFPFKINKTNETAAPILLSKHTALPPCSLTSNLLPLAKRFPLSTLPLSHKSSFSASTQNPSSQKPKQKLHPPKRSLQSPLKATTSHLQETLLPACTKGQQIFSE